MWGDAPKKSTKNAVCATFRRRIVNDSRSLYRTRRASYISIFSPSAIRRKTVWCSPKINLISKSIESRIERQKRGVYLTRWLLDAHSRTGTEITIVFLTEKDRQMAEKRRKKWRPFCLANLRRPARWAAMYAIFFQKKSNQNKCTWSSVMTGAWKNAAGGWEMSLLARIFFREPFSYGKSYAVALLRYATTPRGSVWVIISL